MLVCSHHTLGHSIRTLKLKESESFALTLFQYPNQNGDCYSTVMLQSLVFATLDTIKLRGFQTIVSA